jgi:DNA polymerase-3 subunit epsilon
MIQISNNQRLIFFDTETTGLSTTNGDKIVEIGCVEMINGIITGEHFHHYINPERHIPAEVVKIHGITNEKVKDSPKFHEIAQDFLNFIEGAILIAHNANFDIKFINHELNLSNLPQLNNIVEDTLKIARIKFPGAPASLDALCKRFEVDLTDRSFHGALLDSKLLACVYRKMVLNDQSSIEFNRKNKNLNEKKRPVRPLRNIGLPTTEEQKIHSEYIKKHDFV